MKSSEPKLRCSGGITWGKGNSFTTQSCKTKSPLIDIGGNSLGDKDYYKCPDCGEKIIIYHGD
jgi:DNA-directed RNA polymerase subunit RPC12/RpoP